MKTNSSSLKNFASVVFKALANADMLALVVLGVAFGLTLAGICAIFHFVIGAWLFGLAALVFGTSAYVCGQKVYVHIVRWLMVVALAVGVFGALFYFVWFLLGLTFPPENALRIAILNAFSCILSTFFSVTVAVIAADMFPDVPWLFPRSATRKITA